MDKIKCADCGCTPEICKKSLFPRFVLAVLLMNAVAGIILKTKALRI